MWRELTLQDQFLLDLFQHCELVGVLQHLKGASVSGSPMLATFSLNCQNSLGLFFHLVNLSYLQNKALCKASYPIPTWAQPASPDGSTACPRTWFLKY